jgi:hypothetical protein
VHRAPQPGMPPPRASAPHCPLGEACPKESVKDLHCHLGAGCPHSFPSKADVGPRTYKVHTPRGSAEIVQLLLAAGASPEGLCLPFGEEEHLSSSQQQARLRPDASGCSPIMHAWREGNVSVVQALLAGGAHVNTPAPAAAGSAEKELQGFALWGAFMSRHLRAHARQPHSPHCCLALTLHTLTLYTRPAHNAHSQCKAIPPCTQ